MSLTIPALQSEGQITADINGCLGLITLNRPQALNALSLAMIRDIATLLTAWATDPAIQAVALIGAGRPGKAPAFCAGGDIRYFHTAVLAGDTSIEDFFTEEYRLNHQIHGYQKPIVALMDGIVMGGGMGISQGAKMRVLTELSKVAMPETIIGLFPDVGGGHFLANCPGATGEWLALTGDTIGAADAIDLGLGDVFVPSASLAELVEVLRTGDMASAEHVVAAVMQRVDIAPPAPHFERLAQIDQHFGQADVPAILASLAADPDEWAQATHAMLLKRSPLALAVTLEQIRRARTMSLADDLRMERDIVYRCFHLRPGAASETMEGIRALAVDKDHAPRWNPARIEDVTREQVLAFFDSPWAPEQHPLRELR